MNESIIKQEIEDNHVDNQVSVPCVICCCTCQPDLKASWETAPVPGHDHVQEATGQLLIRFKLLSAELLDAGQARGWHGGRTR